MAGTQDDNVYQMRRDIKHTQVEMHETIDAIRRKLDPDRLKNQAQDAVRDATIGRAEDTMSKVMGKAEDAVSNARDTATDASSGLMDTIRQNPIPAALAGISLGWLFMNRSSSQQGYPGYYDRTRSSYGRSGHYYGGPVSGRTTDSGFPHQARRSSFGESEGEGPLGQVTEKAGEMKEAASEMMDEVRSRAGDMMGDTGEMVTRRGSSLLDTVKENPIPAALAGIGLGWLLMNGGPERQYGSEYTLRQSTRYGGDYEGYSMEDEGPLHGVRSKVGDTMGQATDTVGDLASRAQETVGDVSGKVGETVGDVSGKVGETVGSVPHMVQQGFGSVAHGTRHQYSRVEDRFQETLDANPLAIGAAAVAVGAIAAMMTPATSRERRFMGEARDNLVGQVQSTAQDTLQKVQRVAEQVQDTVKEQAKEEGLTQ